MAIGASAAAGQLSLALLLIIGFGAHNATEGFGIVAPLAAGGVRPSWRFLLLLGHIPSVPIAETKEALLAEAVNRAAER